MQLAVVQQTGRSGIGLLSLGPPSLHRLLATVSVSTVHSNPVSLGALTTTVSSLISMAVSIAPSSVLGPGTMGLAVGDRDRVGPGNPGAGDDNHSGVWENRVATGTRAAGGPGHMIHE